MVKEGSLRNMHLFFILSVIAIILLSGCTENLQQLTGDCNADFERNKMLYGLAAEDCTAIKGCVWNNVGNTCTNGPLGNWGSQSANLCQAIQYKETCEKLDAVGRNASSGQQTAYDPNWCQCSTKPSRNTGGGGTTCNNNGVCDAGEPVGCDGCTTTQPPAPTATGCCQCKSIEGNLPYCSSSPLITTEQECEQYCGGTFTANGQLNQLVGFNKQAHFPSTDAQNAFCYENTGVCGAVYCLNQDVCSVGGTTNCFVDDYRNYNAQDPSTYSSVTPVNAMSLCTQTTTCDKCNGNEENFVWCEYDAGSSGSGWLHACAGCSGTQKLRCSGQCIASGRVVCSSASGQSTQGDYDNDGHFSYVEATHPLYDCDDANPLVNRDAMEVCDDGIDNNCDGFNDLADPICLNTRDCVNADYVGMHGQTGPCIPYIAGGPRACFDGYYDFSSQGTPGTRASESDGFLCLDTRMYSCGGSELGPAISYTTPAQAGTTYRTRDKTTGACVEWSCDPTKPFAQRWSYHACGWTPAAAQCGDTDGLCPANCYSDGTPADVDCPPTVPICGDGIREDAKGECDISNQNYCAPDCGGCPSGTRWDAAIRQCVDNCYGITCGANSHCEAIGTYAACVCNAVPSYTDRENYHYYASCGVDGLNSAVQLATLFGNIDVGWGTLFRFTSSDAGVDGCEVDLKQNSCCDINNAYCAIDQVQQLVDAGFSYDKPAYMTPMSFSAYASGQEALRPIYEGNYLVTDSGFLGTGTPTEVRLGTIYGNQLLHHQSCDKGIYDVLSNDERLPLSERVATLRSPDWYGWSEEPSSPNRPRSTGSAANSCCMDGRIQGEGALLSNILPGLPDAAICQEGQIHLCNLYNPNFDTASIGIARGDGWVITQPDDSVVIDERHLPVGNEIYVCVPKPGMTDNPSNAFYGLGVWELGEVKTDWDNNPDKDFYCAKDQCGYYNDSKPTIDAKHQCVPNGFIENGHFCNEGMWSTQTQELADALFQIVTDQNIQGGITLYCDTKENVMNIPPPSGDVYVRESRNFCVISYESSTGKKGVAYGSSLNTPLQNLNANLCGARFNYTSETYGLCLDTRAADGKGEVMFYNPKTQNYIFAFDMVPPGTAGDYYTASQFKTWVTNYIAAQRRAMLTKVLHVWLYGILSPDLRMDDGAGFEGADLIRDAKNTERVYYTKNATGVKISGFIDSSYRSTGQGNILTYFMVASYKGQCPNTNADQNEFCKDVEQLMPDAQTKTCYVKQSDATDTCYVFVTDDSITVEGVPVGPTKENIDDAFNTMTAPLRP